MALSRRRSPHSDEDDVVVDHYLPVCRAPLALPQVAANKDFVGVVAQRDPPAWRPTLPSTSVEEKDACQRKANGGSGDRGISLSHLLE